MPPIVLAWASWFALALILVGLDYLMATGATSDIARTIVPARVLQPGGLETRPT